jgi:hypothetical protein
MLREVWWKEKQEVGGFVSQLPKLEEVMSDKWNNRLTWLAAIIGLVAIAINI